MPGLPFPDVSFDGVAAGFVISHLASQVDGLREMVRICKSGGRVGVTTWGTLPTVTRRVHTGLSHRPRHQTMNLPTSVVLNLTVPFTATNRVGDRVIGLGMVFEAGRGLTAAVHASGISSRPGSRPLIHDVAWCPIPHDGWVRARSRRCSPIGNGSATSVAASTSTRTAWWSCAAIVVVCLAVGLPTVRSDNYFLGDDFGLVQHLHDLPAKRFLSYFVSDWTEGIYGYPLDELRPLLAFSYWLDAHVFGPIRTSAAIT